MMIYQITPLARKNLELKMDKQQTNALAGWMVLALIVIGLLGLFTGILSFINEYDYIGTGLCLIASALAFGTVLKMYR